MSGAVCAPPTPQQAATRTFSHLHAAETRSHCEGRNRSDGQWTDFLARGRRFYGPASAAAALFCPGAAPCGVLVQEECSAHAAAQRRSTSSQQSLSWVETWAWAPQPPPPAQGVILHCSLVFSEDGHGMFIRFRFMCVGTKKKFNSRKS